MNVYQYSVGWERSRISLNAGHVSGSHFLQKQEKGWYSCILIYPGLCVLWRFRLNIDFTVCKVCLTLSPLILCSIKRTAAFKKEFLQCLACPKCWPCYWCIKQVCLHQLKCSIKIRFLTTLFLPPLASLLTGSVTDVTAAFNKPTPGASFQIFTTWC